MVNPTGYTALDLIGFTDKGAYSSSTNYVKNDLVHYSGNIWRCLIDDTSGIEPAEGVNWTLFIGEPTNLVERIIAPVETDPATSAWAVGRQIIFNDNLYEVITAITAGDALVTYEDDPTNANIKLADPVESQVLAQKTQIQTLMNQANDMVNVLGAKNQLKYSLTSGTTNEVVYTVNSDKTISVTTTGATESSRFIDLQADLSNLIHGETYILNGCPSGGAIGTYVLYLADGTNDYIETENGVQFVYDSNKTYALRFVVYVSVNLPTPIVFKPMIRLASIKDSTYEPYAMTNQELTNRKLVVTSGIVTSDQTTVSAAMADLYSKIEAVTASLSAGQLLVLKRVSIAQTRAADVPITFAHHNLNDVIYATVNEVGASVLVLANFIIYANSANNSAFLCVIDGNGATFSNEISKTISGTSSITYDIVECA